MIFKLGKFIYELTHELLNDLKNRTLGNIRKISKQGGTQLSVQSPLQKLLFGNTGQKLRRNKYQNFLTLTNFRWFIWFLTNILSSQSGRSKPACSKFRGVSVFDYQVFECEVLWSALDLKENTNVCFQKKSSNFNRSKLSSL